MSDLIRRKSTWIGAAIAAVLVIMGAATGGVGGALVMLGMFGVASGLWGVVALGRTWIGPTRRLHGVIAAGAALAVVIAGGSMLPRAAEPAPVVERPTVAASASPSASAAPAPTPTESATPSPTPTADPVETEVPAEDAPAPVAATGPALAAAQALGVKGRAPRTGYDRDLFGSGWKDPDRSGCDARNDILARDLAGATFRGPCTVMTGSLADPYSGQAIAFERGETTSQAVQIDHVVALSDAWQKGAQSWTDEQRVAFANDPLNLLAVDGPTNAAKSDGDTATWLPPNKAFRCAYVARQVAVKASYGLWVTSAEQDAMVRVLTTCPDEQLPSGGEVAPGAAYAQVAQPAPVEQAPDPEPAPVVEEPAPAPVVEEPAPVEQAPAQENVYYANCDAVRAAGAAPLHAGEPGYETPRLDRDGDGIACE
ncbi:GmrSD restriction endonuclease domain-containing protein [Microbacterium indicum]|uniref:GmrSD restriction endonuclease domain-containing protein n=1 Tax=Microbacterium indicum TaxID=358100 RepID=UPI00040030C9|nr:DUF1524 domain-containing protein [Microbacterium indicum]